MTAASWVPWWGDESIPLDHLARYPVPPVSHRVVIGKASHSAPTVVRLRGATAITEARLDAMRGQGRLNTKQVQGLWLRAGVPVGVGGALPILTHYLGKGWIQRPVKGTRNVCALWEVTAAAAAERV